MNTIIGSDGSKRWYNNAGKLHREDGPALIEQFFTTRATYYINGQRHRLDGPAVIWGDGDFEWFKNGELHRLDGPAIQYGHNKEWWIDGERINCSSNEEFLRIVKMK
jgi:hypothetical protein